MSIIRPLVAVGLAMVLVGYGETTTRTQSSPRLPSLEETTSGTFVDRYCVACHSQRLKTGGLTLDDLTFPPSADSKAALAVWEKVLRKVRTGAMPPAGARRPESKEAAAFLSSVETTLDRIAAAVPDPGVLPAVHRLNRTEYRNAIRDLLAVDHFPKEMDISVLLPPDDAGEGFDNMAAALYVSPVLIERYLAAARRIGELAVGDLQMPTSIDTYQLSGDLPQDVPFDELPFGTRGGMSIRRTFPLDGEYTFAVQVARGGVFDPSTEDESYEIEITIDGQRAHVFVEEKPSGGAAGGRQSRRSGGGALQARIPVKAGPHEVGVAFIARAAAPVEALVLPYRRGRGVERNALAALTIAGPEGTRALGDTPSRQRIFECRPATERDERPCASRILSTLARRAYRRPSLRADVEPLLRFFDAGRAEGGFELGIRRAIERLLVSPEFLFRIELPPADTAADAVYRISDLDLASRVSFFLWSSIPDDALLEIASKGQLKNPPVLERQVRRMLADPRSDALVANFVGQWLYLRDFVAATRPDDRLFPDFDDGLKQSMARETELFFDNLVRENRSIFDLLRADFTFVNDRLARHYGLPNVYGSRFRRVALPPDSPRRGLLGQGSVLTVTSYANRTSPVNRGKFILDALLSMPPPPPPPDVPALMDHGEDGKTLSMRARMERHRTNPACASCHVQMDPLGFALENFDATGRWRVRGESHEPIDNSGVLPNGATFSGVGGLREVLLNPPYDREFRETVIAKMLMYALGRGLDAGDQPAIRKIARDAATGGYRFDAVILGIVKSVPFQMRRARGHEGAP
jgi:hypothetical protein